MKTRISITTCQQALSIARWTRVGGIPLTVDGEERVVTDVVVREGGWHSQEGRLTRSQQEELTRRAQAIIEENRRRFPRLPPKISIRECREAIGIGGGIAMRIGGEERTITELRTGGGGNTRWFSGGHRFTVREQVEMTRRARALIEKHRNG